MGKGLGRQVQIGVAKETVRGTAEAAATYWIPFSEGDAEEKLTLADNDQALGVIEDTTEVKIVGQHAEISVKGAVGDTTFPLFLFAALGTDTPAAEQAPNALAYDHIITVAQSIQHQSLTVFVNDPLAAADYKHALGCVDSLELDYETGKFIEFTAKLKAKKGATATLTPANTAENLFLPKHFVFKLAATQAGLTAASAFPIKSLKLTIAKGLESDDVLGNVDPADYLNKKITFEGTLEAVWQNEADFKTAFLAGTTQAMRIDMINTDKTIATSANPEIQIDFNKVVFKELTRPFKVGDVVKQTLKFKALYNTTDSKMVSIKATNLVASY